MSLTGAVENLDSPHSFGPDGEISRGQFLHAIARCARSLPDHPFAINICEDRYDFVVGFFAALLRGQTNVLLPGPASAAETMLESVRASYPDAYVLASEHVGTGSDIVQETPAAVLAQLDEVAAQHTAAIVFSSGTTGLHKRIEKTWTSLYEGALINQGYHEAHCDPSASIVATVPPWHMYGLEWSVMLPLVSGHATYARSTLFPDDIRAGLAMAAQPRMLVSTPLHLRALLDIGMEMPAVTTVMSATAPLDPELASQIEEQWNTRVFEIYGCSEMGTMAFRFPASNPSWAFFDEFTVEPDSQDEFVTISAAHTGPALTLADQLAFEPDGKFRIVGRDSDMVKVAGKRGSLADINQVLLAIEGVTDGVVFDPAQLELEATGRLAALVVSRSLGPAEVRAALVPLLDPAFIPRPLLMVEQLPRNETGKLRREDLRALVVAAIESSRANDE